VRLASGPTRLRGVFEADETAEAQLDWREEPDDDLVLALAIAAWEAEQRPGLAFSYGYGVSEFSGWRGFYRDGPLRRSPS